MLVHLREHRLKRERKKKRERKTSPSELLPCRWGGTKQDFSHFYECKHQTACIYSEFYARLAYNSFLQKKVSSKACGQHTVFSAGKNRQQDMAGFSSPGD